MGFGNQDGNGGIAIGQCAGRYAKANNILIGTNAGKTVCCSHSIMIGSNAGGCATGSCANVIIGLQAGSQLTTGDRNTFLGTGAGIGNQTGHRNISIGDCSGPATTGATGS